MTMIAGRHSVLARKERTVRKLRVWCDGSYGAAFDIRTPYPLAGGATVEGTVNGSPRMGVLDSNLYTVYGPGGYVGEFADTTPGPVAVRWFDSVLSRILIGSCEIIEE